MAEAIIFKSHHYQDCIDATLAREIGDTASRVDRAIEERVERLEERLYNHPEARQSGDIMVDVERVDLPEDIVTFDIQRVSRVALRGGEVWPPQMPLDLEQVCRSANYTPQQ